MTNGNTPIDALDRLLALRSEDQDGWEESQAETLDPQVRRAEEAKDQRLAEALQDWARGDLCTSNWDAAAVLALAEGSSPNQEGGVSNPNGRPPITRGLSPMRWSHRKAKRRPARSYWTGPASLAASLALLCFAAWQFKDPQILELDTPVPSHQRLKATTDGAEDGALVTQVLLQASVEREGPQGASLTPAKQGQRLGVGERLAFLSVLQGQQAYLHLAEITPQGQLTLLDGGLDGPLRSPGAYSPQSGQGLPQVYRPDMPQEGLYRYLSLATTKPVEGEPVVRAMIAAGLDRPDLWPRPVRAAAEFTVEWSDERLP